MRRINRLLGPILLGVSLIAVLAIYVSVVDDLPGRIYTPDQQSFLSYNRNRMIVQEAPAVMQYSFLGEASQLTTDQDRLSSVRESAPVTLVGDEHAVRATLIARYEEKNRVSATIYDLDFRGEYHLASSGSPSTTVEWFFPFPANLETLHDVRFMVADREPDGVDYSTQGIRWTTQMKAGEELDLVVSYRAEGASSFSYSLPREGRVDVDVIVTVEGLTGSESTQNFLRPTSSKELESGELFSWTYTNLIADRDIRLELPARLSFAQRVAQLQDQFRALSRLAPALVLAFLAALVALTRMGAVRLRPEIYLMAGVGLALFYPLLTFLSGLVDIPLAAILSISLVSTLLTSFLGRAAGWRQVRWRVGLLLIIFLGFFSLGMLTPWQGLSLTAGAVLLVALFMVLLARRPADPVSAIQSVGDSSVPEPLMTDPDQNPQTSDLAGDLEPATPDLPSVGERAEAAGMSEPAGPHCPFCGNRLGETYRFCPVCGHQTDQIGACPDCGARQFMPAGQESVHCLVCGAIVA